MYRVLGLWCYSRVRWGWKSPEGREVFARGKRPIYHGRLVKCGSETGGLYDVFGLWCHLRTDGKWGPEEVGD